VTSVPRIYDERCGVAHALDLVGQRWALLVVRELVLGPKRFTDLRAALPRISPDVLSQRLREQQDRGVIRRRKLPPPAGSTVYELTEWGRGLEPAIVALARWGGQSPFLRADGPLGADSIVLGLRTFFDPDAAAGLHATCQLNLGDARFTVRVADGQIEVVRGETAHPDVVLEADPDGLSRLLRGRESLTAATRAGRARLSGDASVLERLLEAVELPRPQSPSARSRQGG
jgi:DNA-binding HxlR family transcriptional regulator/putative sterol carrier protein